MPVEIFSRTRSMCTSLPAFWKQKVIGNNNKVMKMVKTMTAMKMMKKKTMPRY